MSSSPYMKRAIAITQQREWVDAQHFLIESTPHIFSETQAKFTKENQSYYSLLEDYQLIMDQSIYKSLFIETQKNLNHWEELQNYSEQNNYIMLRKIYLFNFISYM